MTTENATFTLINKILTAMNKSRAAGISCDIKTAFNCVNHNILLAKWSSTEYQVMKKHFIRNI
jgi:hypothetical protein